MRFEKLKEIKPEKLHEELSRISDFLGITIDGNKLDVMIGSAPEGEYQEREITQDEIDEIRSIIDAHDATVPTDQDVEQGIAALEAAFNAVAQDATGEPEITPLLLDLWKDNYKLARQWDAEGRPDPTADSTYADAVTEASNRTDELADPVLLLEVWLQRGQEWVAMKRYMDRNFRPKKRAAIRAATTVEEIEQIKATLEPELRSAFGL